MGRTIKYYSKLEFGNRTPSLSELVKVLPHILDNRSTERVMAGRRLVYRYLENKSIDEALEEGNWTLNAGGMKRLFTELKAAECKAKHIQIEGYRLTESYTGKKTKNYTGHYECNGIKC